MWAMQSAEPAVHPTTRNGSAHVTAGTSQRVQRLNASRLSRRCADRPVEQRAGLEHRMYRDRQFAGQGHTRFVEPTPLRQPHCSGPERRSALHTGEQDTGRLKQVGSHSSPPHLEMRPLRSNSPD
jgi:hypothetical protein